MHYGEDIIIKGKVSENLLFHINNDFQAIYGIFHPHLKKVTVHADTTYNKSVISENVATGFSGGIDSFYTLGDHYYHENVPAGFRVTHLLYNNVGSHGGGGERLCAQKYQRLKNLAIKLGLPFIAVNSNLQEFYKDFSFIQTHTPRDASVGLLLQKGIGKYLYSSSVNYQHLNISPKKPVTFSDSIILPKLSTSSIQLISTGSATSRVEKTIHVSDIPDSWEYLDVCIDEENEVNCSHCSKCLKTQLTMEIAGTLERFSRVFDYQVYKKARDRFITSLYRSKSIHHKEILNLAREKKYHLPLKTKLFSILRIYGLKKWLSILPGLAKH